MSLGPDTVTAEARSRAPIPSEVIIAVCVLHMLLTTLFTAVRMWCRFSIHQQFWWDDWAMVIAWLGTLALCSIQLVMVKYGAGVNVTDLSVETFRRYSESADMIGSPPSAGKLFVDIQMVARVSIFFARLAILLLYVRIFFPLGVDHGAFWWVIQVTIWLNVIYSLSLILLLCLQCVPTGKPWGTTCVNQWMVLLSASIINIISDIAVLIIPMGAIWRLRMNRQKRYAVWALFGFGALAPLSSIARLAYQIPVAKGANKTVIYQVVIFLATAEQVVSVVAGCMPVATAWLLRLRRRRARAGGGRNRNRYHKRTITQRLKPKRETMDELVTRKKPRRAPDPFPITGTTLAGSVSEEELYSDARVDADADAESGDHVELTDQRHIQKSTVVHVDWRPRDQAT